MHALPQRRDAAGGRRHFIARNLKMMSLSKACYGMQARPAPCVPVVWTPDGGVVIAGPAAPMFAERQSATVFTGPFFASQDRTCNDAIAAWIEIGNAMTPQPQQLGAADQSKLFSTSSAAPPKYSRENITVHMHKFHAHARKVRPSDCCALDAALGLVEAFFACKGRWWQYDSDE